MFETTATEKEEEISILVKTPGKKKKRRFNPKPIMNIHYT
jgi:hypothetical protein